MLTPKQTKFLCYLMECGNKSDAIKKANISTSTAYRWMEMSEFKQELNSRKNAMLNDVCLQMQSAYSNATSELIKIINSNYAPQIRINAINSLFLISKPLIDQCEILTRLQQLEENAKDGEEND